VDYLRRRQSNFNAASRDQWAGFALHRARVSALLGAGAAAAGTRLCVLGAGNGNDLDLAALLAAHREVHLVDLDGDALASGVWRQGMRGHPGLFLHGGLDVTAMLDDMATWTPLSAIEEPTLAALMNWPAERVASVLPGRFDRVVSTCLLSQLIDTARHALVDHPEFGRVAAAIRAGHLRLLARLAVPLGAAVLISDVVSSEHLPTLSSMSGSELAGLLPRLARSGNHIGGVHPAGLRRALLGDDRLGPLVVGLRSIPPWLWRLHERDYLVWAMEFRIGPDGSR
jgi:hypothetical protein